MHKHRRAENVPRIKASQENQDQTLACDVTIFLRYEKMPRIWIINKKISDSLKACFAKFSPEHILTT